ncbi:MAG: hypothetical protein JWP25_8335 [Bradyrhizobium sp.]|nr:hypothetical protein [Bradyrhizobium sp.]
MTPTIAKARTHIGQSGVRVSAQLGSFCQIADPLCQVRFVKAINPSRGFVLPKLTNPLNFRMHQLGPNEHTELIRSRSRVIPERR